MNTDQTKLPDLTPYLSIIIVAALVLFLLFFPLLAAAVAPAGRRLVFFCITFFLGPLGIGFAAVAQPRPLTPVVGRRLFICDHCEARNNVKDAETSYTCWQCSQQWSIEAKHGLFG